VPEESSCDNKAGKVASISIREGSVKAATTARDLRRAIRGQESQWHAHNIWDLAPCHTQQIGVRSHGTGVEKRVLGFRRAS
jgi:hypothetical protein